MLYNLLRMWLSTEFMLSLLVMCALGMALLAAFYLRGREISFTEHLAWGSLLILIPFVGPFLVILLHPGARAQNRM